jgi:MoaA/NifB/PqqE/SkfB family radical SAM enzyme
MRLPAQRRTPKLAAVEAARKADLPWSGNFVLHRSNIERIARFIRLAESLGAFRIELANTQFYGWAFENRRYLLPTRNQLRLAQEIVARRALCTLLSTMPAPRAGLARSSPSTVEHYHQVRCQSSWRLAINEA